MSPGARRRAVRFIGLPAVEAFEDAVRSCQKPGFEAGWEACREVAVVRAGKLNAPAVVLSLLAIAPIDMIGEDD